MTGCHDLHFLNVELKPTFSLSSFTFIKRLFSSSSLLAHVLGWNLSPSAVLHLGRLLQLSAAAAKSLQSCPTLWDPRDGSPPGSPIPGILQARTLEWVAISFSNA